MPNYLIPEILPFGLEYALFVGARGKAALFLV
jgi:hypothetical protein